MSNYVSLGNLPGFCTTKPAHSVNENASKPFRWQAGDAERYLREPVPRQAPPGADEYGRLITPFRVKPTGEKSHPTPLIWETKTRTRLLQLVPLQPKHYLLGVKLTGGIPHPTPLFLQTSRGNTITVAPAATAESDRATYSVKSTGGISHPAPLIRQTYRRYFTTNPGFLENLLGTLAGGYLSLSTWVRSLADATGNSKGVYVVGAVNIGIWNSHSLALLGVSNPGLWPNPTGSRCCQTPLIR